MGTRLDQTRKGRLRGNSFDPDLTNRADTYFDRGCSTAMTKGQPCTSHLGLQYLPVNENPMRQITSLALSTIENLLSS